MRQPPPESDALAILAEAREHPDDEHARYARYVAAIPGIGVDGRALELFCELVASDADGTMAGSAAAAALVPGVAPHVVAAIGAALYEHEFVQRRIAELALLGNLSEPAYRGDVARELAGASGWLEEKVAELSESRRVLEHLAKAATRRRARTVARERAAALEARH